jgi:small subunit ribosomal protein S17
MKIFIGTVISKKMVKTATVVVERVVVHPIYKKRVRLVKKYQVHDDLGTEVGQQVRFAASKPFSKTKKWKVLDVVKEEKNKKTSRRNKTGKK